jgi:dTDP-4-dehydrorhamnose 3,5-epimerase
MERLETRLEGPALLRPVVHRDERGFFHESYRRNVFGELGIPEEFVQDNHSRSARGIVRGMHFQVGRGAAKLVRCARGAPSSTSWSTSARAHRPSGNGSPSR